MTSDRAGTVFFDAFAVDFERFVTVTSVSSEFGCVGEGCGAASLGELAAGCGAVALTAAFEVEGSGPGGGELALTGKAAGAGTTT